MGLGSFIFGCHMAYSSRPLTEPVAKGAMWRKSSPQLLHLQ
jgi:hypothetical protein